MRTASPPSPEFDAAPVGTWTEEKQYAVQRDILIRYAEATGDDHPAHRSGELATPVFHAVPAMQVCDPLAQRIIPDHAKPHGLHGEQDFRFHQPIRPGMTLVSRAYAVGFHPVKAGVTVTVKGVTHTADGEPVSEQYVTVIMRGATTSEPAGDDRPAHTVDASVRAAAPAAVFTVSFEPDTPIRYAHASGDFMPIHTDDTFARTAGLPGIINHGLCTLAYATRRLIALTCADDPTRVRRLAVRFSRVVQPHQTLTSTVWDAGVRTGSGRHAYAFDAALDDGHVALKDGLIEVAD